jgi:hypothetical protein
MVLQKAFSLSLGRYKPNSKSYINACDDECRGKALHDVTVQVLRGCGYSSIDPVFGPNGSKCQTV